MILTDNYYTVKEVAQQLKLAEITIRQWIAEGKIESVKIGTRRRIPREQVQKLIEGSK